MMPANLSSPTVKRRMIACMVALIVLLISLKQLQYYFENKHHASPPHPALGGIAGRLDDLSFWMFVAATFSISTLVEARLRPWPRLGSPIREVPAGRDRAARMCWIALVPMVLVYAVEIWHAGDGAFHPKARGWRWVLKNLPTAMPWGAEHWIQIVDSLLSVGYIVAGCAIAAFAVRRLACVARILNESAASTAVFAELAEPLSLIMSAGLGPVSVFTLWWGVWHLLRRFILHAPWLGTTAAPNVFDLAGPVVAVAVLCLPYVIVYVTGQCRLYRPYRFRHSLLKLIWLGPYGGWISVWLKGTWLDLLPGAESSYRMLVYDPAGHEHEATGSVTAHTCWTIKGPFVPPPRGYRARVLPGKQIELSLPIRPRSLVARVRDWWRDHFR